MTGSSVRITIAVCTFNRSPELDLVLSDLAQQIDEHDTEVLVVDNNSTDQTSETVAKYRESMAVRYVLEPRQGIGSARSRALREAAGEYLIFLDDDVRLHPAWYAGYRQAFLTENRLAVTGAVRSTWPARVPGWIGDTTHPLFPGVTVHYAPSEHPRSIGLDDPMPFTANLGIRLDEARVIGFNENLGHIHGKAVGGEDMDFCRRFIQRFGDFWYDPEIAVDHPVVQRRMTLSYTFGYLFRGAVSETWYAPPATGGKRIGPIPLWTMSRMAGYIGRAGAGALTANPRRLVSGLGGCVRVAGIWWGLLNPPKGPLRGATPA